MIIHSRLIGAAFAKQRLRTDRGSESVSTCMLLVFAVIMATLVVLCFRLASTRLDLNATAASAARAASIARNSQAATDAATTTATANLASHHRTCNPMSVNVDTSNFVRGGSVGVTITCTMSTAGLTGLGLPGTVRGSATARAYIDLHRGLDGDLP